MQSITLSLVAAIAASPTVLAQCFPPTGTALNILQDSISAAQPIGFAFPFAGSTYTDIHVSDHGIAWLSNAGVPAPPTATPLVYTPDVNALVANGPVIAVLWSDSIPGAGGDVFIAAAATQCTITWHNVQTFGVPTSVMSFSLTLLPSGEFEFNYDPRCTNNSTFGFPSETGVVGASAGTPNTLPTASDLSTGPFTTNPTLYELFPAANTFDMKNDRLHWIPTNPGYVTLYTPSVNCAEAVAFGSGCIREPAAFYEEMMAGAFDLSSTSFTAVRSSNGYVAIAGVGTYVPPSGSAMAIAIGDDIEQTVGLSAAMPVPGGTTNSLTVSSNGNITLGAVGNGAGFTPSIAGFLSGAAPNIAAAWHDYNPTIAGSGQIKFEQSGGIAYVTWDGVYSFATTTADTFQVQFTLATGDIAVVYNTISNAGNNYVVGLKSTGNPSDLGASDLSVALPAGITIHDVEILPLTLASSSPTLGSNWTLTTSHIDPLSPIAITFFGNGPIAVPGGLPLTAIGLPAPGCFVNIDALLASGTTLNAGGSSMLTLPLPNTPSLSGAKLGAQSICLTAANAANLLTSNGIDATLGF